MPPWNRAWVPVRSNSGNEEFLIESNRFLDYPLGRFDAGTGRLQRSANRTSAHGYPATGEYRHSASYTHTDHDSHDGASTYQYRDLKTHAHQ
jgi:hypothetical protein